MFGEGINVVNLFELLNSVKEQPGLVLEVKVLDSAWAPIDPSVLKQMVQAIRGKKIQGGNDIRLRLYQK